MKKTNSKEAILQDNDYSVYTKKMVELWCRFYHFLFQFRLQHRCKASAFLTYINKKSIIIFIHTAMQATPLRQYGLTMLSRKFFGKISVGDSDVKINANANSRQFVQFFCANINHIDTPAIAIMKVGDSALWLNITIQISNDASIFIRKLISGYCLVSKKGSIKTEAPMATIANLFPSHPNHEFSHPNTEYPYEALWSLPSILRKLDSR